MKIGKSDMSSVNTFPGSKSVELKIGNTDKILKILRGDLYSNPLRTAIQEYMSNAVDAHTAAKVTKPIEITFPSNTHPIIRIRDFGSGLKADDVKNILCNYGVSTKDSDDSSIGGFGLGVKSGFAYTDSFVFISYSEGLRSVYLASLSNGAGGMLELIEETESKETGCAVELPIQARDFEDAINAAVSVSLFWGTKPLWKTLDKELIDIIECVYSQPRISTDKVTATTVNVMHPIPPRDKGPSSFEDGVLMTALQKSVYAWGLESKFCAYVCLGSIPYSVTFEHNEPYDNNDEIWDDESPKKIESKVSRNKIFSHGLIKESKGVRLIFNANISELTAAASREAIVTDEKFQKFSSKIDQGVYIKLEREVNRELKNMSGKTVNLSDAVRFVSLGSVAEAVNSTASPVMIYKPVKNDSFFLKLSFDRNVGRHSSIVRICVGGVNQIYARPVRKKDLVEVNMYKYYTSRLQHEKPGMVILPHSPKTPSDLKSFVKYLPYGSSMIIPTELRVLSRLPVDRENVVLKEVDNWAKKVKDGFASFSYEEYLKSVKDICGHLNAVRGVIPVRSVSGTAKRTDPAQILKQKNSYQFYNVSEKGVSVSSKTLPIPSLKDKKFILISSTALRSDRALRNLFIEIDSLKSFLKTKSGSAYKWDSLQEISLIAANEIDKKKIEKVLGNTYKMCSSVEEVFENEGFKLNIGKRIVSAKLFRKILKKYDVHYLESLMGLVGQKNIHSEYSYRNEKVSYTIGESKENNKKCRVQTAASKCKIGLSGSKSDFFTKDVKELNSSFEKLGITTSLFIDFTLPYSLQQNSTDLSLLKYLSYLGKQKQDLQKIDSVMVNFMQNPEALILQLFSENDTLTESEALGIINLAGIVGHKNSKKTRFKNAG